MPAATSSISALPQIAARLRIDSVRATTAAGSGHPSTCCSAADLVAALFFGEMRYDPQNPRHPLADRCVFSKGHAAPLLYAAWAEAGLIARDQLLHLRELSSDLEGHPTPRLPFVDVATGSLGQGLAAGVGIALNARRIRSDARTYVLMGDGETAEGSVWEAAASAQYFNLDSLCAIVDVNALGQSQATQFEHDLTAHKVRWEAFGWQALTIDGHNFEQIVSAFETARWSKGRPTVVIARTLKGKGISFIEAAPNWHGKALKPEEADRAIAELERAAGSSRQEVPAIEPPIGEVPTETAGTVDGPSYTLGQQVATREAFGAALAKLGTADPRVVALDGDVKNSTFSEKFEALHPERFYQMFIAEQVMVGAAMGLASRGAIPFASTFAAFLTRAADFVRMAAISHVNVKLVGSHAGVSIGEDGPSQMALEDLAMATAQPGVVVLYPSDAVSAERLTVEAAHHHGPVYLRASRPKVAVIYGNDEPFPIGGSKVLRRSDRDTATLIAAGVTVFEALRAHELLAAQGTAVRVIDAYSVAPIDADTLRAAARETGRLITVEDHYPAGGLGDAVARAVAPDGVAVTRLAVEAIPRSGKPDELLDAYGISAQRIVSAVSGQRP